MTKLDLVAADLIAIPIDSKVERAIGWDCEWDPGAREVKRGQIPLRRIGEPADFAGAMLYLAADAAYVTGHTLVVDGGYTL